MANGRGFVGGSMPTGKHNSVVDDTISPNANKEHEFYGAVVKCDNR